jgi:hypothetical protein
LKLLVQDLVAVLLVNLLVLPVGHHQEDHLSQTTMTSRTGYLVVNQMLDLHSVVGLQLFRFKVVLVLQVYQAANDVQARL